MSIYFHGRREVRSPGTVTAMRGMMSLDDAVDALVGHSDPGVTRAVRLAFGELVRTRAAMKNGSLDAHIDRLEMKLTGGKAGPAFTQLFPTADSEAGSALHPEEAYHSALKHMHHIHRGRDVRDQADDLPVLRYTVTRGRTPPSDEPPSPGGTSSRGETRSNRKRRS